MQFRKTLVPTLKTLVPTLCVGTQDLDALRRLRRHVAAERQCIAFPRGAWERESRRGGVYIAVLGTSMIVSLLAITTLMAQRIQNRQLTDSADIRQAELNAGAAIELALLTMKQNTNWRATQPHGSWFTGRDTGAGTCSVTVTDPVDSNLANSADDPLVVRGVGYRGQAQQQLELTFDSRKQPLACLRSAVAAGDQIDLTADTLRTNGMITANQTSASASQVYGNVEAVSIGGSTYSGTTTQINASKLPAMPDWATVFSYYRTNGTQLIFASLPTSTPNLGRNVGIENGTTDWLDLPTGEADLEQKTSPIHSGTYSLKVKSRDEYWSGAAQRLDHFVKPNQGYLVEVWLYHDRSSSKGYRYILYTKGTTSTLQYAIGPDTVIPAGSGWTKMSATLTAPSWTGNLEYAYIVIAGTDASNEDDFNLDDFDIRETTTGSFIYRKVLSPTVNTLYVSAPTNSQGIYWINCNGNRLVIERSRIVGTLLVVNPGPNSCVADGPINWAPAVTGYPALLVDADIASNANFSIRATNRALSEAATEVNFNPNAPAVPYEFASSLCSPIDNAANDLYPSEIRGLVVVRNDLTYQNNPLVRGQVIVGGDISNSSGALEVAYQPEALLNPPPGFLAPYAHQRRPGSARKVVLP